MATLTMGRLEWLLLVALSMLWGGTFFFVEIALVDLPPFTIVLTRVALAALLLWLAIVATGRLAPTETWPWRAYFVMGALNNVVPFSLIFWGQTQLTGGLAAILNATPPLFTVLLAHFLTVDERLRPHRLAGVMLGLVGVAVLIGFDLLQGLRAYVLAEAAVLGAALSYAFAGIFGRRFKGQPPIRTAAGQLTASSAMMLPLALLVDRPWTLSLPSLATVAALAGLALLSTALAYIIFFRILAAAGATNLLLVTLLIPVSAFALGAAFLGEQLAPRHVLGMGLIGLGLAAIDGRPIAGLRRVFSTWRISTRRGGRTPPADRDRAGV